MTDRATVLQRFLAFIIDLTIIGTVCGFVLNIIYLLINFDIQSYNKLGNDLVKYYLKYMNGDNGYLDIVIECFKEYTKETLFLLPISAVVYLLIDFFYLVFLPKHWSKQTVGRFVTGCRVVALNGEASYKNFLLRELVGTFIFYQLLYGISVLISAILTISGRSLVDYVGGTMLVSTRKVVIYNNPNNSYNPNDYNQNNDGYNPNDYNQNSYGIDDDNQNDNQSDDEYRIF